jgi:hypothetical protein
MIWQSTPIHSRMSQHQHHILLLTSQVLWFAKVTGMAWLSESLPRSRHMSMPSHTHVVLPTP